MRKVECKDGKNIDYWFKGEYNPCKCGSNLFHHELDENNRLFGVCNACGKDIYEFKFDESVLKAQWIDKKVLWGDKK